MKQVIVYISFLFIVGVLIWKFVPLSYSVCDQAIGFRVDTIDPEFKLPRETFLSDINQAAQIWNQVLGKKLFTYDPKGDLSINLIYDERQSLTNQIDQLEDTVKSEKQALNPKISQYQSLVADFKQKLNSLNQEIEYWNNQGGAPPDEYKKIIDKQHDLQTEKDQLNALAQSLNISTDEYNSQVNQLNQTIGNFNNALEQRPEEGIFKGSENRIEIYFNINKNELVHTLAHELGHALSLMHNSNPKSIMYYKTSQTTTVSNEDLTDLENVCRKRSILELLQNYLVLQYGIIQHFLDNYARALNT